MKARWLIITLLLAFPFAFAFFLSEVRRGERRSIGPALVVAPSSSTSSTAGKAAFTPSTHAEVSESQPIETPADLTHTQPDEQIVELARGGFVVPAKPVLLQGSFANEDNSLIYDADAKLLLSKDVILSSPTGVMVSNEKQTLFAGDMQIESGKNIVTAHEGVLDTTTSQMKATVASISFTNENNQLVRMTGENVTLELPSNQPATTKKEFTADSISVETPPAHSSTPAPAAK